MNSLQEHPAPERPPLRRELRGHSQRRELWLSAGQPSLSGVRSGSSGTGRKRYQAARVLHGDFENVSVLRRESATSLRRYSKTGQLRLAPQASIRNKRRGIG